MSDIFREVEEDLRHDRYQKLWDRYGLYVILVAVGLVAIAAATAGWRAYSRAQAEAASERFTALVAEAKANPDRAAEILSAGAETLPSGYETLTRFRAAGTLADQGNTAGAVTALDAIAADATTPDIFRGLAQIKAATLIVDGAPIVDIQARLLPLTDAGNPWRNDARELLGLAEMKADHPAESLSYFQAIVSDQDAPAGLRDRANMMIALLGPKVRKETAASAEAAEPTNDTPATAEEETAQ